MEAIYEKKLKEKTQQDEVKRLFNTGRRMTTAEDPEESKRQVTYSSTTYDGQDVVIVKFVGYSAEHVWGRLVAREGNEDLIAWTTEPGIFMIRKRNPKDKNIHDS
jgi:hypothetical protein